MDTGTRDAVNAPRKGGLGSEALLRFWCWCWYGIARREREIWRYPDRTGDEKKERIVCLRLRHILVRHVDPDNAKELDDRTVERLAASRLSVQEADLLEAELRELHRSRRGDMSGREVDGNWSDAFVLVLQNAIPLLEELRAADLGGAAAPFEPGALSPSGAFAFHARLSWRIERLESRLTAREATAEERERVRARLPREQMVLAQWVASIQGTSAGAAFTSTYEELAKGVDAAAVRRFAGWLRQELERCPEPEGPFALALDELAKACGVTRDELATLAPAGPPPWTPPEPLPPAKLPTRGEDVIAGSWSVPKPGENRNGVPFHQFLAALDRELR
jgi:hypothetical protein